MLKRGGYATQAEAEGLRQKIEQLLDIPEAGPAGDQAREEILRTVRRALKTKTALPDYDEARRRHQTGQALNATMTVGQWLDEWLAGKRGVTRTTVRSYEGHIRLHLKPRLGHLLLEKLRGAHIQAAVSIRTDEQPVGAGADDLAFHAVALELAPGDIEDHPGAKRSSADLVEGQVGVVRHFLDQFRHGDGSFLLWFGLLER